jgi:flagellar basal-body rod modification protein FlgD
MSTIDPNSSQAAIFAKLGISQTPETQKEKKDTLGQSDFLKLMTTQLQNQDPFAPMDNGDFIAQMAQFSTVTGIQEINNSIGRLVEEFDQARIATASNLLGHSSWCQAILANQTMRANFMECLTYLKARYQQNSDI